MPRGGASAGQALAEEVQAVGDVAEPAGLLTDLALDAQGAGIPDRLQRPDEPADVDLARAQGDLLAPGPGGGRPLRVLDVDAPDVRPEDLDGADRVAHVVEEH